MSEDKVPTKVQEIIPYVEPTRKIMLSSNHQSPVRILGVAAGIDETTLPSKRIYLALYGVHQKTGKIAISEGTYLTLRQVFNQITELETLEIDQGIHT